MVEAKVSSQLVLCCKFKVFSYVSGHFSDGVVIASFFNNKIPYG